MTINRSLSNGTDFIKSNIGTIGAAVGGAAVGAGLATAVIVRTRKKRTKKNKRKATKSSHRKLKFGSKAYRKKYLSHSHRHKQRKPHTAGKRKDTSHRRIRYTKNNQPYIILGNGRARFISKKSVNRSRKLKGGKY